MIISKKIYLPDMAERVNIMNNKLITASKNDTYFSLFNFYLQTAQQLKEEMSTLFNTGIDKEKSICSTSNMSTDRINNIFEQETINSVKNFLNNILDLKYFSDCKLFQEFLFEDSERYSLCSCYPNFAVLNDIEIFHAETCALEEM